MDSDTIQIIGIIFGITVSPLYVMLLWRMKKSDEMNTKLTKICTFIKLKFPDEAKRIFN